MFFEQLATGVYYVAQTYWKETCVFTQVPILLIIINNLRTENCCRLHVMYAYVDNDAGITNNKQKTEQLKSLNNKPQDCMGYEMRAQREYIILYIL